MNTDKSIINGYILAFIFSLVSVLLVISYFVYKINFFEKTADDLLTDLDDVENFRQLKLNLNFLNDELENGELDIITFDSVYDLNKKYLKELRFKNDKYDSVISVHNRAYSQLANYLLDSDKYNLKELKKITDINEYYNEKLKLFEENNIRIRLRKLTEDSGYFSKIVFWGFIISALVLFITIYKFYITLVKSEEKSKIIDDILTNTKDKINHLKPIRDGHKNIIDFSISHKGIYDLPFESFDKTKHKQRLSKVFKYYKDSGLHEQLIHAFKDHKFFENIIEFPGASTRNYYKVRYFPDKYGIKVLFTDLSSEFLKREKLENLNRELNIKNKLFEEAEQSAKLGSYIWYMDEDQTIMSDNVFRILGLEPQSIPMSAGKFREFTHPEDLQLYDETVEYALSNNTPIEFTFRIIDSNKEIKSLYTKGSISKEFGRQIMIGIIQDVSSRVHIEQSLKKKNLELNRKVEELDSFNHIVSHDLQEPLRKIQMFISRIEDSYVDDENPNQKYFDKIFSSAKRMRSLINNLLAYSRIDNEAFSFELVNLNDIVNDVFDKIIESNPLVNITFEVKKLPELYAIPFLIEQLFYNLIGNAVKYKNPNKDSKIVIESIKIHRKQIPIDFIKTHLYYHQIKIIDNGIGFDHTHSKDIFKIFTRLHTRDDYEGTGIGLAISKKIVTRNYGYIYANSIKGKGSVFTIYLPSGRIS